MQGGINVLLYYFLILHVYFLMCHLVPFSLSKFSKATYNLKTGDKVASSEQAGLFGGIAKAVFSAQEKGPLRIFALGEKAGKILFSMD